jgi:hypothetical protein
VPTPTSCVVIASDEKGILSSVISLLPTFP